jgi:hypothetical protein
MLVITTFNISVLVSTDRTVQLSVEGVCHSLYDSVIQPLSKRR